VVAAGDEVVVVPSFAEVLRLVDGMVAVDMPIGLPDQPGPRACDRAARRLLGPRRSSVFPAPSRAHLAAASFGDVGGLSIQAWNLVPKVREVDAAWEPRVREVGPEVSFAAMAGAPMAHPKRTAAGRDERLAALGRAEAPRVPGARPDDVLDALACAWTAARIAAGTAVAHTDGSVDGLGRPMTLWV
jgi:predicted RNase H-like nuclease